VFVEATQTAAPIIRPMWLQFPSDDSFSDVISQFMWGENFLVAPKLHDPWLQSKAMLHKYTNGYLGSEPEYAEVEVKLPTSEEWYNYNT
jgi:alpha-glucosidase (family GH31 glycosyl hydrolase)